MASKGCSGGSSKAEIGFFTVMTVDIIRESLNSRKPLHVMRVESVTLWARIQPQIQRKGRVLSLGRFRGGAGL